MIEQNETALVRAIISFLAGLTVLIAVVTQQAKAEGKN